MKIPKIPLWIMRIKPNFFGGISDEKEVFTFFSSSPLSIDTLWCFFCLPSRVMRYNERSLSAFAQWNLSQTPFIPSSHIIYIQTPFIADIGSEYMCTYFYSTTNTYQLYSVFWAHLKTEGSLALTAGVVKSVKVLHCSILHSIYR